MVLRFPFCGSAAGPEKPQAEDRARHNQRPKEIDRLVGNPLVPEALRGAPRSFSGEVRLDLDHLRQYPLITFLKFPPKFFCHRRSPPLLAPVYRRPNCKSYNGSGDSDSALASRRQWRLAQMNAEGARLISVQLRTSGCWAREMAHPVYDGFRF